MKNKILILLIALSMAILFAGCGAKKATLIFVTYSESVIEPMEVTADGIDSLVIPEPIKEGFGFSGWYFDKNLETEVTLELLKQKLNNDDIKLYAKWERVMEKDAVIIHGKIGDKYAINPVFDWDNSYGDSVYSFTLKDSEGNVLVEEEVENAHYELAKNLEYGKTYSVKVLGLDTSVGCTVEFTTIDGTDTIDLKKELFNVCEPYKSHMVIQREREIEITGRALPNVVVTLDFYDNLYYAVANSEGKYSFTLPKMQANSVPHDIELRVLTTKKITITDVLVGDVYLVSGQSNVQWSLKDSDYLEKDVDNAVSYDVRYFSQDTSTASKPITSTANGKWFKVNKSDSGYVWYSAVAFMVGSMLGKELHSMNVPLGIVYAAQGDTNIVNWMSKEYYDGSISTKNQHYNAMINPLDNAKFSGVIWYQGCNNSAKGIDYKGLLHKLFANWRELFNDENLPFYVVQLPVYDGDQGNNFDFSYVRESQFLATEEDENAYLIASCDGGDPTFIHPTEKRYICERLTKSILSTNYSYNYAPQGPTYKEHVVDGNKVIITVNNGDGLRFDGTQTNANGKIVGFMLAGADGKYFDAEATISGGKIIVTSPKVAEPKYVKYGFGKSPFINIYNRDGYLMSPFRTDNYNRDIDLLDYSDNPNYRLHPDGSKMEYEVVTVNGKTGTKITKAGDGKGFGSLILDKWGAIGYNEKAIRLTMVGSNSGASVAFRIVEGGSYKIYSYSITDNFEGEKTFTVPMSEFSGDGEILYQQIMQVEITITHATSTTVTILEARFVDAE